MNKCAKNQIFGIMQLQIYKLLKGGQCESIKNLKTSADLEP